VIITVQRGSPAEEKLRRWELRERIISLGMEFMPSDEDIETREELQREYYALLVLADSEGALAAYENKDLQTYSKIFGTNQICETPSTDW